MPSIVKSCIFAVVFLSWLSAARAQTPLALDFLIDDPALKLGKNPRYVPVRSAKDKPVDHPTAKLAYHGGPLLADAQVYPVFWGPQTWYTQGLVNFYSAIGPSEYAGVWAEYSTAEQRLGAAAYAGTQVLPAQPTGRQIDDRELQRQLASLIRRGALPRNASGNLLFAVHLPPAVVVTAGPHTSCIDFCGYHSTFVLDGDMHYYFVVPDHGNDCAEVCGAGGADPLQRTTATSSRLLAASIVNPAAGVASDASDPLGWYDVKQGDIGDPCAGQLETVEGWTVQKVWSNDAKVCRALPAPRQ